jgi:acid stress-induced BolA-like protein IbaG/YrbA
VLVRGHAAVQRTSAGGVSLRAVERARYPCCMIEIRHIEGLIESALPGSQVTIEDFGGGDHLFAHVRAPQFAGLPLLKQHKLVYAPVQHLLDDGTIHALKIKTEATA